VAYADWKSGVRGLPLYSQHIPGFEKIQSLEAMSQDAHANGFYL